MTGQRYDCTTPRTMNSRSSSFSFPTPRLQQRPSFSARLSSAVSLEQGSAAAASGVAEHQIDEEIEEIKRYEVSNNHLGECNWRTCTDSHLGLYNHRYLPSIQNQTSKLISLSRLGPRRRKGANTTEDSTERDSRLLRKRRSCRMAVQALGIL